MACANAAVAHAQNLGEREKDLLRFSTAGSVDDGKSTLIGRLLYDTQSVYDDQVLSIRGKYDAVLSNEDVNEIFGDMCFNLLRDDMRKLRAYDPTRGAKLGSWLGQNSRQA